MLDSSWNNVSSGLERYGKANNPHKQFWRRSVMSAERVGDAAQRGCEKTNFSYMRVCMVIRTPIPPFFFFFSLALRFCTLAEHARSSAPTPLGE